LEVTLDVVHHDDEALVADLERRLGGRVMHHQVNDIDYVRDTMVVDVRYRATRPIPAVVAPVAARSDGGVRGGPARPPGEPGVGVLVAGDNTVDLAVRR
jgi:hypothetical protein